MGLSLSLAAQRRCSGTRRRRDATGAPGRRSGALRAGGCTASGLRRSRVRAALLAGQCQIRTGLYPEALASLDRVRSARDLSREQFGDVEFYRGVALYHLERYAEAGAAFDGARGLTGEEARALYTGASCSERATTTVPPRPSRRSEPAGAATDGASPPTTPDWHGRAPQSGSALATRASVSSISTATGPGARRRRAPGIDGTLSLLRARRRRRRVRRQRAAPR